MNKIPVWKTIRFAYAFTFGDIGTIIGLIWLPTLLIGVLQFLPYAMGTQLADESSAAFLNFAFFFASLLLYAMNAVAVTQLALGKRPEAGASVHFSLGWSEWRVQSVYLCCVFLFSVLLTLYFFGLAVYAAAGFLVLLYLCLRLVPIIVPVIVAEEGFDLARGWRLMSGNMLRMLAVLLAVSAPLAILQGAATLVIVGPALVAPLPSDPHGLTAAIDARVAAFSSHMPEQIGLFLIMAPFSFGLAMAAGAAAYRALTAPKPQQA